MTPFYGMAKRDRSAPMAGDFSPSCEVFGNTLRLSRDMGAKAPVFSAHGPDSGKSFEPASNQLSADVALALDYALRILVEPDLDRALTRIKQDMDFGHLV